MLAAGGGEGPDIVETAAPAATDAPRPRLHLQQPPWRLLTAPETVRVDLNGSAPAQRRLALQLRSLVAGTQVVLCSSGWGSRRRSRRFARDAGITGLHEYVGVPSFYSPTCYVQDEEQALRYFFTEVLALPRGGAAISALVAAAKVVARRFAPWMLVGGVAPARIAVGRAGTSATGGGTAGLLELAGMRTVVLALSKDPNAKLTILLIPPGKPRPALVVKVPTTETAESSIAAERHTISDIRARLPDAILATIPRFAELAEADAGLMLVTTALPGIPMSTRYHAWRHLASQESVRADFMMADRWLSQFQATSTGEPEAIDLRIDMVDALANRFAREPGLSRSLDRLQSIRTRLGRSRTPRTAVHGDYWFGNILVDRNQVSGVIDWEAGSACGEPVLDLVRFALSYALYMDRHARPGGRVAGHPGLHADRWGAGIEYGLEGRGWFPDLFRNFIQGGLKRLGADPASWRDAVLAGLAEVAVSADHPEFALRHWRLFERLTAQPDRVS